MEKKFYNVSSVRLMRFLYALGFQKESYFNNKGKENWRFIYDENLSESLNFYHQMRQRNKSFIE